MTTSFICFKFPLLFHYKCINVFVFLSQPPPLRLFLLGPRGSGKTVVGRRLAKKLEVFHVAFRDYMQETVLPKMKRPPLVNEDEWEGGEEGEGG